MPGTAPGHAPLSRSHAPKQTPLLPLPCSSRLTTEALPPLLLRPIFLHIDSTDFSPAVGKFDRLRFRERNDCFGGKEEIGRDYLLLSDRYSFFFFFFLVLEGNAAVKTVVLRRGVARCTRNLRHAVQYYTEGEYFTAGQVQRKRRHRRYGTRRRILNRS